MVSNRTPVHRSSSNVLRPPFPVYHFATIENVLLGEKLGLSITPNFYDNLYNHCNSKKKPCHTEVVTAVTIIIDGGI